MARKKIQDLLGEELTDIQTPVEPKSVDPKPQQQTLEIPNLQTSSSPDSEIPELPKYLQLERKEVRVRIDQMDALTKLSRKLNRNRKGQGERITENTLIRVAIDLLLENSDRVHGLTEDELLESLGLFPKGDI
jgi:hypothetical protein